MVAGEVGFTITCKTNNAAIASNAAGAVNSLICISPISRTRSILPMTALGDGSGATYVTNGNDFTEGGIWQIEYQIAFSGGNITRAQGVFQVQPAL